MNHNHPNFALTEALVKLPDGSYTSQDLLYTPKTPWRPGEIYPCNARPSRWKLCAVCLRHQPIAEFLIEGTPLRTVIKQAPTGEEFAYLAADVREWCKHCDEYMVDESEETS